MRFLSFHGILLGLVIVYFASLSAFAAPVVQLKAMSFNILNNGGQSLTKCVDAIRTSGADIVGLQECDGPTARNIATQLGFQWMQSGTAGQYAVVSRYPIVNRIGETINAYGGLGVTIELSPNQRTHFFVTHLNYVTYGPYLVQDGKTANFVINNENTTRMPGLTELLGLASPYLAVTEPAFLVGDFNAPSHLDYAALNWPESVACLNAGFSDSYRILHPSNRTFPGPFAYNDPGITWTPMTSQEPRGVFDRIDFVYASNGDGTSYTAATELDGRNSVSPWPSDHRAVLSTFNLTMPAQQSKATNAIPANNATNVSLRPLLTWIPGSGTNSHNIYFGNTSPGTLRVNQTDSSYAPGLLAPNTSYFWRIDELKSGGNVTGDVWTFQTGNFAWVQPSMATYSRNQAISISVGNGPGNKTDWIGLYAADAAYGTGGAPSIDWFYLNGTKTAPKNSLHSAVITFPNGLPNAGNYVVRLFKSDGFYQLDAGTFSIVP